MVNEIYKVCVYMSTYNGEKYLREQIDSILNQRNVETIICIRDDGSKDGTVKIIQEYIEKGCPVILECGENIGFAKSFMQISQTKIDADYYAFSDQDDVWKKDKLARAVRMMNGRDGAVLYGGNIFITDENLQYKGTWCNEKNFEMMRERILRYYALGYNLYGCSMVWNRKMQELIWKHMPHYINGQDVYVTMLAGALGEIIVDKKPMTLHRIHAKNTAGIESNLFKKAIKGYKLYLGKNRCKISNISKEIASYYKNDLNKESNCGMVTLFNMADYKNNKINLLRQLNIKILGIKRYLWIAFRVMFNRY